MIQRPKKDRGAYHTPTPLKVVPLDGRRSITRYSKEHHGTTCLAQTQTIHSEECVCDLARQLHGDSIHVKTPM